SSPLSTPDTCKPSHCNPSSNDKLPAYRTFLKHIFAIEQRPHNTHTRQQQPLWSTRRQKKRRRKKNEKSDRHPRRWQEIQTRSRPVTSGPHPAPKARADPRNTALAHFRTSDDTRPLPPSRPHLSVPSFPPLEILYSRSACCLFIDWTDLVACSFFQSNQRTKYGRFLRPLALCVCLRRPSFFSRQPPSVDPTLPFDKSQTACPPIIITPAEPNTGILSPPS
ncbi:uncharacterized protein CCOS01_07705, partial [Colletotrichum costaricense]